VLPLKPCQENTIYSLSNTYVSFAGSVYGIYFTGGSGANALSGNTIYSLSVTGVTAGAAKCCWVIFYRRYRGKYS